MSTTQTTRMINVSQERLFEALTDPHALEVWMAPGSMTGKVHSFDLSVGGGYVMSLYYPARNSDGKGKTSSGEDRYTARFVTIQPNKKIVEAIRFDSSGPGFAGEMILEIRLEPRDTATLVTMIFTNIPSGIRPEDNEKGTEESLDKLECYVQGKLA